jgi:hypothetical protein
VTGGPPNFGGIPQRAAGRSKMSVCSTTRVKSATVFSLMIDGSGSLACRIFGRLLPVRIVRKRDPIRRLKR